MHSESWVENYNPELGAQIRGYSYFWNSQVYLFPSLYMHTNCMHVEQSIEILKAGVST